MRFGQLTGVMYNPNEQNMSLLSPLDLAKKPKVPAVTGSELATYDPVLQRRLDLLPLMSGYQTTTFGATPTFDMHGRPWDNDNDSDRNG